MTIGRPLYFIKSKLIQILILVEHQIVQNELIYNFKM
jgi:hypothetical protein